MNNKLHETDETSPQNQQATNNAMGIDEGNMKIIVIVLGVLLLIGFVVVVGTIVYRVSNLSEELPQESQESLVYDVSRSADSVVIGNIEVAKPKGSTLKDFDVEGGIIYLHFENSLGTASLKIVRLSDGMVLGGIGFVEEQ